MKPRHWIFLVLLGLFGACGYRFLGGLRTYVYHGQVMDAETLTPIPEAVVTVVWTRSSIGIDSHPSFLLNVQETVTDANGRFSLNVSPGLDWHPLSTRDDDPKIVIYKPGYQPLSYGTEIRYGFTDANPLVANLIAGATIKLRTVKAANKSDREYADQVGLFGGAAIIPESIPKLMREINAQRKSAGLQELPLSSKKGFLP
jgi:hypothetical protein